MIQFNNQYPGFTLNHKSELKKWVTAVIKKKKRKPGTLNFVLCSDEFLLQLNRQYLRHDTYTDIITFDYSDGDVTLPVSGDIYISVERVNENARKFSKSPENELHRVIIHGTLHLLGYKDKTKAAKLEMTVQEDSCLNELGKL